MQVSDGRCWVEHPERGRAGMQVSRTIGDAFFHSIGGVCCRPDLFEKQIGSEDRWLIVGTDGLWDVMSSDEAGNFVSIFVISS